MKKSLGQIVRKARESRGLTRAQLGKKIRISEAYVSFIERDRPVWISDRIIDALVKHLSIAIRGRMVELHNSAYKRYLKKKSA